MKQTVLAFIVTSLIPPIAFLAAGAVLSGGVVLSDGAFAVHIFPVVWWFSVIAVIVFALPAYLLGKRFNLVRWWSASSVGALIGFIMEPGQFQFLLYGVGFVPMASLMFAIMGAISGLVFWAIWSGRLASK